jgi:hypothetical protein
VFIFHYPMDGTEPMMWYQRSARCRLRAKSISSEPETAVWIPRQQTGALALTNCSSWQSLARALENPSPTGRILTASDIPLPPVTSWPECH